MLKEKIEKLKEKLNKEYKHIPTTKVYSNHVPINTKLEKLRLLPSGLRGAASLVYDALEAHCNEKYEVYASQSTLAIETGYSREWVNYIIKKLVEVGLINKKRRGLNISNLYTLIVKKAMCVIVDEIKNILIEIKKHEKEEKQKNYKNTKKREFTDYDQRNYDYDELEKALLGETEIDDIGSITT